MTGIEKLLIFVVIILTSLLFIVGFQVVLIILDLRKAVKRLNSILEDSILGGGLIRPDKLTGVMELFKRGRKMDFRGETRLNNSPTSSEQPPTV